MIFKKCDKSVLAIAVCVSLLFMNFNVNAELYFKKPVTQLAVTPSSNTGGGTGGNTGGGSTATPNGSLTTSSLTFSGVSVGSVSSALSVSLLSSGTASLTLTAVPTIRAGSSSMFTDLSSNCTTSGSLVTGASCDVSIKFSPTNTSLQTGVIDFVTNAGTFSVNLSGTGVGAPVGNLSVSSITYSGVNVGSTSAAQEVLFQNTGNASLSITSAPTLRVGSSTTFNTLVTSCEAGTTLTPGQTCAISAKFSPTNTSAQSGNIDWETNAGSFTVSLSGTGVGVPGATYSSNGPLSFGSVNVGQSSAAQTYTITNSGTTALAITTAPSLSGTDAAMFNITNNTCTTGASIAIGATCSFDLKFAPTAAKVAQATVSLINSVESKSISLSGTGQQIAPTIQTWTIPTKTTNDTSFTPTLPTSNSSGAWTLSSSNTAVATVSGTTVYIVGAGSTTITATQSAAGQYTSGSTTATLTVNFAYPAGYVTGAGLLFSPHTTTTYNSDGAIAYCQTLSTYGGGWRLPTKSEVDSIRAVYTPAQLISMGWPSANYSWAWTKTLYNSNYYWVFAVDSMSLLETNPGYSIGHWSSGAAKVSCVKNV